MSIVPMAAPQYPDQAPRFLPLFTIGVRFHSPPHTDRRPVFGIISNMSATGTCIITNLSLPVGAEVGLAIDNHPAVSAMQRRAWPEPEGRAPERQVLEIAARVVWCAERFEPVKEIVGYLTGVCFYPDGMETVRSFLGSGLFQSIP
jgi:hypothetical protein